MFDLIRGLIEILVPFSPVPSSGALPIRAGAGVPSRVAVSLEPGRPQVGDELHGVEVAWGTGADRRQYQQKQRAIRNMPTVSHWDGRRSLYSTNLFKAELGGALGGIGQCV